jgi:hypothetical protein
MIKLAFLGPESYNNNVQDFGMHPIHAEVQKHYGLDISDAKAKHNVIL